MLRIIAVTFLLFTSNAEGVTEKKLEELARKEGQLNVGTNHLLYGDFLVEAFSKKYPFIKVNHLKFSNTYSDAADHFEEEDTSKRADVVLHCQIPAILSYIQMKYLADLQSLPNWKKRSKTEDQSIFYHNFLGAPHVIAYNPEKVEEKDLPSSYDDLLDPKWKKKIAMRSPKRGSSPDFFAYYIHKTRGIEWFSKFAKNNPYIALSGPKMHEFLEAGDYALALSRDLEVMSHLRDYKAKTGKESKLKYKFLEKDLPYQYQQIMMNSKAPHSAAAKLFVNWAIGPEAHELMEKQGFSVGERQKELLKHKKKWQWNFTKDKISIGDFNSYLAKVIRTLRANGAEIQKPKARRSNVPQNNGLQFD